MDGGQIMHNNAIARGSQHEPVSQLPRHHRNRRRRQRGHQEECWSFFRLIMRCFLFLGYPYHSHGHQINNMNNVTFDMQKPKISP